MYTRQQMRDHETELAPFVWNHRDHPTVEYGQRVWERHGRWTRYYRVYGGAVHTTLACRTINVRTVVESLPDLAGVGAGVVAGCYRLCRHCA